MWDDAYNTEQYIYGTEPNDFLRDNYSVMKKGKVLCLAEGEGRNAVFLAKQGYDVTAVDSSAVGLKKAEQLAEANNVNVECIAADLRAYDLGNSQWDGVVSIFCHLPAELRKDVLARVQISLKKDSVFLVEGFTPKQLDYKTGGPPVREMMISAQILRDELPDLQFELLDELERDVREGTYHSGLGAVVQGIGRKI